jgi:hypothetical protein
LAHRILIIFWNFPSTDVYIGGSTLYRVRYHAA